MDPEADDRTTMVGAAVVAALIMAQQMMARAVRDGLFLSALPATLLPLAMMAASVAAMGAVAAMSRALGRFAPARVLPWVTGSASLLFLIEWGLCLAAPRTGAIALYLHVALFGGVVISAFWSMMNERFDPHSARRAMGRIGLGASAGGVLGGGLAWGMARLLPVPAMLPLLAILGLAVTAGVRRLAPGAGAPRARADAASPSALGILRRVPYLQALALVVACGAVADAVLDYIFKSTAAAAAQSRPSALVGLFATLNTTLALVGIAAQALLSRRSLARLGLAGTVAVRPACVLALSIAGVVDPRLWASLLTRGGHDVTTTSLFRSGYELLFTPLPEGEKRPTKAVIDVAVDKLGNLVGGAIVLGVVALAPSQAARGLYVLVMLLCGVAMALTPRLQRGYVSSLESSLRAGRVSPAEVDAVDEATRLTLLRSGFDLDRAALVRDAPRAAPAPEARRDPIVEAILDLRSGDPQRIVRVLRSDARLPAALVPHVIPLLAHDGLFQDVVSALRHAEPPPIGQLVDALLDPRESAVVRRRLPRVLRGLAHHRTVDGLILGLGDERSDVRAQCGVALAAIARREPGLVPSPERVFEMVLVELGPDRGEPDLDHVFTLLSLALEGNGLQMARRALEDPDRGVRGTAFEYLTNVLPPRIREPLWPLLVGGGPLGSSAAVPVSRAAVRVQLEASRREEKP
jgi:hypothetical protein